MALKIGTDVEIRDRLWAIVTPKGKLVYSFGERPIIYTKRIDALEAKMEGEHVIRLKDVGGTVVR